MPIDAIVAGAGIWGCAVAGRWAETEEAIPFSNLNSNSN